MIGAMLEIISVKLSSNKTSGQYAKISSFGRKYFVLESGSQKEKYFFHLWGEVDRGLDFSKISEL